MRAQIPTRSVASAKCWGMMQKIETAGPWKRLGSGWATASEVARAGRGVVGLRLEGVGGVVCVSWDWRAEGCRVGHTTIAHVSVKPS